MSYLLFCKGIDGSSSTVAEKLKSAKTDPSLKSICLDRIRIDGSISKAIVDLLINGSCQHLDSIEFVYCKGKVDTVIDSIFRRRSTKTKTTIRRLSIHGRNEYLRVLLSLRNGLMHNDIELEELAVQAAITTAAAKFLRDCITNANSKLKILDLSRCMFVHDSATSMLASGLRNNPHLHTLRLSNCTLEDKRVAELIDAVRVNNRPSGATRLLELSLPLNYCQSSVIQAISSLLTEPDCGLKRLNMAQQFIDTDRCLNLLPIAAALRVNRSLHYLDLRENFLDDSHVEALFDALLENQTLEEINLECSEIGSHGIQALAQRLPQMKGIQRIWLKNNPFSKDDAKQLLQELKSNTTLHILDIGDDYEMQAIKRKIQWHLCLNRIGRYRCLTPNSIPLSHWSVILEQARSVIRKEDLELGIEVNDVVYHLLQGPALFER